MKHTDTPHGIINAASQRFFVALGENASQVAIRINNEPAFLAQLAIFAKNGGFEPSTSQRQAHKIMGANMFGIEDAIKHFGVNPSKEQLATLDEVPFSEWTLKACKATHVLVAVFPMSILDIRSACEGQSLFYEQEDWYSKHAFAKDRGKIGWHLIRKTPVENSASKTWSDQQALQGSDDKTPEAQTMVYTMIGHYKTTGKRLFEKIWVRCLDLELHSRRVEIGFFGAKGLYLINSGDDHRARNIGLASARK
ncbi:MAG: hypothetical protein V4436_01335 [Patescibacteria group bacterium]